MARRKAGVPYPLMYATAEESKNDYKKMIFNCHQRAHLVSIFISQYNIQYIAHFEDIVINRLKYPILSSIGGGIFIMGRLVYAWGYQTGDPSKRLRGAFSYIGLFTLVGTSVASAI
ncbi:7655_t:CDS:2, partial [Diversispora eburnea]